jgi:hypothetical protein
LISHARNRGSMPPEVAAELRRWMRAGRVRWIEAAVSNATAAAGTIALALAGGGTVAATRVVLATGFDAHRPGGALLDDETIDRLGLPCAACGYPIVSPRLEWAAGLFVTGALGELELGPVARNIAGARAAGERLVAAA